MKDFHLIIHHWFHFIDGAVRYETDGIFSLGPLLQLQSRNLSNILYGEIYLTKTAVTLLLERSGPREKIPSLAHLTARSTKWNQWWMTRRKFFKFVKNWTAWLFWQISWHEATTSNYFSKQPWRAWWAYQYTLGPNSIQSHIWSLFVFFFIVLILVKNVVQKERNLNFTLLLYYDFVPPIIATKIIRMSHWRCRATEGAKILN